ncbi:hypothetical protein BaRGS_00018105 [Batillaria attramentaria]|uniref:Uncharacterized protein n=1 Tax=Batillaria attramentaria TaxID=370345 RepID=A0ABD0KTW3_9CAEN
MPPEVCSVRFRRCTSGPGQLFPQGTESLVIERNLSVYECATGDLGARSASPYPRHDHRHQVTPDAKLVWLTQTLALLHFPFGRIPRHSFQTHTSVEKVALPLLTEKALQQTTEIRGRESQVYPREVELPVKRTLVGGWFALRSLSGQSADHFA